MSFTSAAETLFSTPILRPSPTPSPMAASEPSEPRLADSKPLARAASSDAARPELAALRQLAPTRSEGVRLKPCFFLLLVASGACGQHGTPSIRAEVQGATKPC